MSQVTKDGNLLMEKKKKKNTHNKIINKTPQIIPTRLQRVESYGNFTEGDQGEKSVES